MGNKEMMDPWCDRVAAELDAVVVSTDGEVAVRSGAGSLLVKNP